MSTMSETQLAAPTEGAIQIGGVPLTADQLSALDTDKLQQLLDMKERLENREAERAFNEALTAFQADMPPVFKARQGAKGAYHYANYEDVMKAARPHMQRHGLSVSFDQTTDEKQTTVICKLAHRDGHARDTRFTLPLDQGNRMMSSAQAQGSANSYARRYALCNALDIVVTGEDDDGVSSAVQTITQEQAQELVELIGKCKGALNVEAFEAFAGVALDDIEQLDARKFPLVHKKLKAKLKEVNS